LAETGDNVSESTRARHIWLTLQGAEIIELKRVMMDRDVPGSLAFFERVVLPRVVQAAQRRGIELEGEPEEQSDERLPG
jgi:hypothetical protein